MLMRYLRWTRHDHVRNTLMEGASANVAVRRLEVHIQPKKVGSYAVEARLYLRASGSTTKLLGLDLSPAPYTISEFSSDVHEAAPGSENLYRLHDGWERVTSMVTFRNGTEVSRDTFRFDRTGNILSSGGSEVYDAVTGRLMSRFANTWTYTYYYDQAGNPDSVIKTKAGLTDRFQYGWDALNRLVSVRNNGTLIARYAYDVLGRRIAKRVYSATTGGTVGYLRFVYHGDHVAFERDSVNALGKRYVWGMGTDDLIGYWLPPNKMYYVVKDKLGSIRSVVIRAGTWQYSERFGPYGESIEFNGTDQGLRYRWTGREYDAETGWYFHRARYYEPAARRFVQEDPIGYGGGGNLYQYVAGQVTEARDPSGLLMDNPLGEMWWDPHTFNNFRSGAIPGGIGGGGKNSDWWERLHGDYLLMDAIGRSDGEGYDTYSTNADAVLIQGLQNPQSHQYFVGAAKLSLEQYKLLWREIFDVLSFTNSEAFIPNISKTFDTGKIFVGARGIFGRGEFGLTIYRDLIFLHPDVLTGRIYSPDLGSLDIQGALRVNIIVHEVLHTMGQACPSRDALRITYLGFGPAGPKEGHCPGRARLHP